MRAADPEVSNSRDSPWERRNPLLTYWYFHLPNFVLAALMYTLLGRACSA